MNQPTKRAPRNRPLAAVLAVIYVALFALFVYLESIGIEDYWPAWALWSGGVTWFTIMMVLPFLVVKRFFGIDLSPLWRPLRRFSLRGMLYAVFWISIFVWFLSQTHWSVQRSLWQSSNSATARTIPGQAPLGLRLLGKSGISRIEIKDGMTEQIAEAKRLFPEATVVGSGEAPDSTGAKSR